MDRNANTRASTMRALSLLCCFEYDEILTILSEHPTTQKIQVYAARLLISERRNLDKIAFENLQQKTEEEMEKKKHRALFAQIRSYYNISPPAVKGRIWTKTHSIEYLTSQENPPSSQELTKRTAASLQKEVLQRFEMICPSLRPPASTPSSSAITWLVAGAPSASELPCFPDHTSRGGSEGDVGGGDGAVGRDAGGATGIPADGSGGDGDGGIGANHDESDIEQSDTGEVHDLLEVSDHRDYDGVTQYLTKWKSKTSVPSWEEEDNFVKGFSLCDYWRSMCNNDKKLGRTRGLCPQRDESHDTDVSMDDGETEPNYEIEYVSMHREEEGVTEYFTKWTGTEYPDPTWVPEVEFDRGGDIALGHYWRQYYENQVDSREKRRKEGNTGKTKRKREDQTDDRGSKRKERERRERGKGPDEDMKKGEGGDTKSKEDSDEETENQRRKRSSRMMF